MKTLMLVILATTILAQSAFAQYGYHTNKRGTTYVRDDSNDGMLYNNANYLNMNGHQINGGRARIRR